MCEWREEESVCGEEECCVEKELSVCGEGGGVCVWVERGVCVEKGVCVEERGVCV